MSTKASRNDAMAGRRIVDGALSGSRYAILLGYSLLAIGPMLLIAMNSLKSRRAIFGEPLSLPQGDTFSTLGYETVLGTAHLERLVSNTLIVTVATVAFVLLFGSMAAFALANYRFRGNRLTSFYLFVGILVPAQLGSVITVQLLKGLGLTDTLVGLVVIYVAVSVPVAAFILTQFLRDVPRDILDAAKVDGAGEVMLYRLMLPLIRPALATVGVLTMIPVWNDLWWPLILTGSRETMTLILGAQQFHGQYNTNWNAILAIVTVAMVPPLLLYSLFSRQLIRGLMGGAVK